MSEQITMETSLHDALRRVELFHNFPDDHFKRLIENGSEVRIKRGDVFVREGDPCDYWYILLDGEMRITRQMNGQEEYLNTYGSGTFFGEVPILMEKPYIATCRALMDCRIYRLEKDRFWQMITSCSYLARMILRTMAQRMNIYQTASLQHEKLISLGTLAAGLAHELNNPAAASGRAAGQLGDTMLLLADLSLELTQQNLTRTQADFITAFVRENRERDEDEAFLDPLAQSAGEDALSSWLEKRGINNGWKLAPTFLASGLDAQKLSAFADSVPASALSCGLSWLEATLRATRLCAEVAQSAVRITDLVQAVKDYSYMDQAPIQEIDVHQGLDRTLTILEYKITDSVTILREYDRSLPCISAYGSELNQVWTGLIDNALDAAGAQGQISIRTRQDHEFVLVEIADNGPGIPPEVQPRIFEPFFTTKDIGQGIGLSLHAAYRILHKHNGDIRVFSQPGNTRFEVRLPIAAQESLEQRVAP